MLNLFRFIGLRQLLQRPGRTSLTVLGVALGIGLSIAIHLINTATLRSFSETIMNVSGEADLSVTAGELGFPEEKLESIENVEGVKHAVPVIEEQAHFLVGQDSEALFVMGVDLLRESAVRSYKSSANAEVMDDPQVFLNQPDSIIVSAPFAKLHNLKMDSKITLATSQGSRPFTVRGILAPEGPVKAFGGAMALMDIDGARVTFGKEGKMDRVDIVVRDGADPKVVLTALQGALGPGYKVERPEERAEALGHLVASFQSTLRLVASLAIVIGLLLVANALKVAVSERRREIGILRSLGTTRMSIRLMFMVDAMAIGLVGAILGCALGWFMAQRLVAMVAQGLSSELLMHVQTPVIQLGAADIVRSLALGVITAVLASLVPSSMAARVQPVEAMAVRSNLLAEKSIRRLIYILGAIGATLVSLLSLSSAMGWNLQYKPIEVAHQFAGPPSLILLTPLLTFWIAKGLSMLARAMGLGIATRIAQDNLMREPGRAANNILTLGLGLYLVVVIAAINASFKTSIGEWADRSLVADLVVSSFGKLGSLQTQPLSASLKQELLKVPGMRESLRSSISGLRFIHTEFQNRTIAIKAFDEPADTADGQMTDGYNFDVIGDDRVAVTRKIFATATDNIAVSKNFADRFRVRKGETITLGTPAGPANFHIVGLVTDFASHEGVIYMSRLAFQRLWRDDLINLVYLSLKPGVDPAHVKRLIDNSVGLERGLMVRFNGELKSEIMATIDQSFAYTRAIEMAALLSGLIGMLNMMFISILERTREIGLLRAVGMSKGQVFQTVFVESITQGAIAGLISISVGLLLAYLWVRFSLANVLGWSVDFHFPARIVWTSILLGILVAAIAGFLPAWRASRFEIKESLAYE